MSHLPPSSQPLPEATLATLDRLGHPGEPLKALDVADLARRSALTPHQVRSLLEGRTVREPKTLEERVARRIKQVFDLHVKETAQTEGAVRKELARHLKISEKWAAALCTGRNLPNVRALYELERFFDVGRGFFTLTAAEALDLALAPVLRELCPPALPESGPPPEADAAETLQAVLRRFRDLPEDEQLRALMQQLQVDPQTVAFRGTKRPSSSQMAALLILALGDDE
ncbi:hypothetical protein [Streptomyces mangrovisoli]|uniref:Uncharacterized protein n=1 Tax=Streptomyces mangrovisoli TaxID=1428628 RepID=A0A1J4NNA8_9ACTN|nr:hypothetical protein [Streptomyces mangrovisoli]OIJ62765.1 hypothetical protein WN71_037795 [Streptomyces mangrovisoli]